MIRTARSLQLLGHVLLLQLFPNEVHARRRKSTHYSRFLFPEGKKRRDSLLWLVREQLEEHMKMKEFQSEEKEESFWDSLQYTNKWDLSWSWAYPQFSKLGPLKKNHRINHIPGSGVITIKNQIFATAERLQNQYGQELFQGIVPRHFVMPHQADEFEAIREAEPNTSWILKSQNHRGVRFFDNTKSVKDDKDAMEGGNMIAQCVNPFLVGGYKFDIGVFVLIASLEPLRIFIHDHAKLRFCQLPYPETLDGQADPESYRVGTDYKSMVELDALRKYFSDDRTGRLLPPEMLNAMNEYKILKRHMESEGIDTARFETTLHQRIVNLVAGVRPELLNSIQRETEGNSGSSHNFFELLRFDFVVDSSLQPALMEVNLSPNMVPIDHDGGISDRPLKANVLLDALRIVLAEGTPFEKWNQALFLEGDSNHFSTEQVQAIRRAMAQHEVSGDFKMVVPSTSGSDNVVSLEPVFMKAMDQVQWDYFAKKKTERQSRQPPNSLEVPKLSTKGAEQQKEIIGVGGVICVVGGGLVVLIMLLQRKQRVKAHAK